MTASFVPFFIYHCRQSLQGGLNHDSETVKRTPRVLLADFESRWGIVSDPLYNPDVQQGKYNGQVGIHHVFFLATFLDPRHKMLFDFCVDDVSRHQIHGKILNLMVEVAGICSERTANDSNFHPADLPCHSSPTAGISDDKNEADDSCLILDRLNAEFNENRQFKNTPVGDSNDVTHLCKNQVSTISKV